MWSPSCAWCGKNVIFLGRNPKWNIFLRAVESPAPTMDKGVYYERTKLLPADAGEAALSLEKQGIQADVVVVDPPRKGLNADAIEALARFSPRRIVYVSCDPATLGRDVALLKEKGYYVQNAMACDLFPRTVHVESIVCLSKLADTYIKKMEIDPEELNTITAKVSPTYPEIKSYVLEHHGLKVSSLAIAQTKKKCGLDVGECYNLPSGHGRPPTNRTPEREAAIREAFQFYGLI